MSKYHRLHLTGLTLLLVTFSIAPKFSFSSEAKEDARTQARRLEVLFLGSPNKSHRPLDRFHTIRRALGKKGINFTYANQPTALTPENLAKYDSLLVYGNHDKITKPQEKALLEYSANGGSCVFLHSACGCFRNSDAFVALLGAQFKSHGKGVFRVDTVLPDHELMKGYEGFECWDESYVHKRHNPDRTILQKREEEPWTWVRTNGKGRIFYTASGHDERCWQQPNYQDLILRAILWTVGEEKAKLIKNLQLPELSYYESEVNILPAKSRGTPLDRRVKHTELQNSLPVEESMKLIQVPVDFQLELFASEPDIVNPIALNWDEKGRMWAVEAYDYPNNHVLNDPGEDRIKILEDTDNDGKADKVTVFAEGLSICTTVLSYQQGCITTDKEEMVYLSDTNGDGKADTRKVLFSGLQIWDTHACTSNLRYGFDGWIYATVGYSKIEVAINGKTINSGGPAVFRFQPDGSDLEILQNTTNNTWGLGFTEEAKIMGSTANNNPSWWFDVPKKLYLQAGLKPKRTPRADIIEKIFPITFDYLQVDCKESITAGAGHALYTARLFPEDWHNKRALICAPTAKLVSAPIVKPNGSGFKTVHFEQNLYASADSWSAPVAAEVGPDGAVYIADWYNSVVQHNVYGPDQQKGPGNAYLTKHRDRKHGRIYRISPKNKTPDTNPVLNTRDDCLKAFSHSNLFWRLTAQRTLLDLEKDKNNLIEPLQALLQSEATPALHAMYMLTQILSKEELNTLAKKYINSENEALQLAAMRHLSSTTENANLLIDTLDDYPPNSKHAALIHIASVERSESILNKLKTRISDIQKDQSLIEIMTVAIAKHSERPTQNQATVKKNLSKSAKRGEKIYTTSGCVACHQTDGEGLAKTYPPLNQSEWLKGKPDKSIGIILKGLVGEIKVRGETYTGAMPAQPNLKDQQIADVLTYIRTNWDNNYGGIKKDDVTRVRAKLKDRLHPFEAKDFNKPAKKKPAKKKKTAPKNE